MPCLLYIWGHYNDINIWNDVMSEGSLNSGAGRFPIKAGLFDVLILFVLGVSIFSELLLVAGVFSLGYVLVFSALLVLALFNPYRPYMIWSNNPESKAHLFPILFLVLVACVFRGDPFNYILGGQDQGVYENMSKSFEITGGLELKDGIRSNLSSDTIKEIYDNNNLKLRNMGRPGKYEGYYVPGVYIKDHDKNEYVFQFYHMHPLWMSVFGQMFGDANRTYSLVFFSLITIVAFYFLAFEITGSVKLATLTGLLLAVNPLHAFFSKFSVTEIVALGFSSCALLYLVKYYRALGEQRRRRAYLILSVLLLGGMFFTRISGFMYIPFFLFLLVYAANSNVNTGVKKEILLFVVFSLIIYSISVFYGLKYSFPYSFDIYNNSFNRVLKSDQFVYILYGVVILTMLIVAATAHKILYGGSRIIDSLYRLFGLLMPYLFFVVVAAAMFKVYQLGFTDRYDQHASYGKRWSISGSGWEALSYSSLYVFTRYISPFIVVLFGFGLFYRENRDKVFHDLLMVFLFGFLLHFAFLQWVIPYQFYYARYLLSEILPYSLLFAVVYGAQLFTGRGKIKNRIFVSLIALAIVYSLVNIKPQMNRRESQGVYDSLVEVSNGIGKGDLLLMDRRGFQFLEEIRTSLIFYFQKNVFLYGADKDLDSLMRSSDLDKFADIYILSQHLGDYPNFSLENTMTFERSLFEHAARIPRKFKYISFKTYLYKLDKQKYFDDLIRIKKTISLKVNRKITVEGLHEDAVWTKGVLRITNLNIPVEGEKYVKITLYGYHPYMKDKDKMGIKVSVNNEVLEFSHVANNSFYFNLKDHSKLVNEIQVESNTFIPDEIGLNRDTRELGLDIKNIVIDRGVDE